MAVYALIPARGGSKRVPGKNTRRIKNQSLLERAIATAKLVPEIGSGQIYVTTDDPVAIGQATMANVAVIERPREYTTDLAPMYDVINHALGTFDSWPEIVVLLQPSTPTRTWQMVQDCIQMLKRSPDLDSIVTVTPIPVNHHPQEVMVIRSENDLQFWFTGARKANKQELEQLYIPTGSVYAFKTESFYKNRSIYGHCRPYVEEIGYPINVDTPEDWAQAEERLR